MTINLIPPKLKEQKKYQRLFNKIFNIAWIAAILPALLVGGISFYNRSASQEIESVNVNIASTEKEIEKLKVIETQINQINEKIDKISTADQDRAIWSTILTEIAESTPVNVLIKTANLNKTSKSLALTGNAETREDIAKFKEMLEESEYFTNVFFSSSSYSESTTNYTFSLSADMVKFK